MDNFFKLALLGLMIIFLIIALHYINWLKPVENALIKVLGPGQEKIYSLVLDIKDFHDQVEDGLAVVAGPGVMVGKIYDVYADHSKVLLLTDNQSRVAATIQNLNNTTGLVEGQFGLSFAMTNIPQDQEVKNGDLIVTS